MYRRPMCCAEQAAPALLKDRVLSSLVRNALFHMGASRLAQLYLPAISRQHSQCRRCVPLLEAGSYEVG